MCYDLGWQVMGPFTNAKVHPHRQLTPRIRAQPLYLNGGGVIVFSVSKVFLLHIRGFRK